MTQPVNAEQWWDAITDLFSNDQPFTAELNGDEGTVTTTQEDEDE